MRTRLTQITVILGLVTSTLASPVPIRISPPSAQPNQELQPRSDLPKPKKTIAVAVLAGVLSSLTLVLTTKAWSAWNTKHMEPRPFPSHNPQPPESTKDEQAVTDVLARISKAAEGHEGDDISSLQLSPEDVKAIEDLTPEQRRILASVLTASAETTTSVHKRELGLPKDLAPYFQAIASGILGGAAFAAAGLTTQSWVNKHFGPKSSWTRRDVPSGSQLEDLD